MGNQSLVRVNIDLYFVPLRGELADAFIETRKLFGSRNQIFLNGFNFIIGGDIISVESRGERRFHRPQFKSRLQAEEGSE
jgi:hypothetical protein